MFCDNLKGGMRGGEGGSQGGHMCICIKLWLICIVVWQRPTQCCKAITFRLKKIKNNKKERTRFVGKIQIQFCTELCFEFELQGVWEGWGEKQQLDGQVKSSGEKPGLAQLFLHVGFSLRAPGWRLHMNSGQRFTLGDHEMI